MVHGDVALTTSAGEPRINSPVRRRAYGPNNAAADLVKRLIAPEAEANDELGYSVAISRNTVVAGAPQTQGGRQDDGVAYVFERYQGGAGIGGEVKKLEASDAAIGDRFGWSVEATGDFAHVGAYVEDAGGIDGAGG